MKALVLKEYVKLKPTSTDFPMLPDAPLAKFALENRPEPAGGDGESVVHLKAAAINPMDLRLQAGLFPYSSPAPIILGNEGAGVVEKSKRFAKGDRVMVMGFPLGVMRDGTHQETVVVPDEYLYALPAKFSFEEGAAFLIAYATAQLAVTAGRVKEGDFVIVTGAAGAIGRAAVQLVKALKARPIAVVSSAEKAARLKDESPDVIDLSTESLSEGMKRITGKNGAAAAIDVVGGADMGRLLPALSRGGVLVCLGYLSGKIAPIVIPFLVGWGRSIVGSDLYEGPAEDSRNALALICKEAENGTLRPAIDSKFTLDQYEAAYARVGSRKAIGKVVFVF